MFKKNNGKTVLGPADCIDLIYKNTPPYPINGEHRTDFIIINKKHKSSYICSMTLKDDQKIDIIAFQMYLLKMMKKDNAKSLIIAEYGDVEEKGIKKDTQELITALMPIITALNVEIVDYIVYNGEQFYSDAAEKQKKRKSDK